MYIEITSTAYNRPPPAPPAGRHHSTEYGTVYQQRLPVAAFRSTMTCTTRSTTYVRSTAHTHRRRLHRRLGTPRGTAAQKLSLPTVSIVTSTGVRATGSVGVWAVKAMWAGAGPGSVGVWAVEAMRACARPYQDPRPMVWGRVLNRWSGRDMYESPVCP